MIWLGIVLVRAYQIVSPDWPNLQNAGPRDNFLVAVTAGIRPVTSEGGGGIPSKLRRRRCRRIGTLDFISVCGFVSECNPVQEKAPVPLIIVRWTAQRSLKRLMFNEAPRVFCCLLADSFNSYWLQFLYLNCDHINWTLAGRTPSPWSRIAFPLVRHRPTCLCSSLPVLAVCCCCFASLSLCPGPDLLLLWALAGSTDPADELPRGWVR